MARAFVDVQVNGWMGVDFTGPGLTVDQVLGITEELVSHGTAALCPTVITGDPATYRENLRVIAEAMKDPVWGPHLLGIHLEGPFISPEPGAVGAHPRRYVLEPSIARFDEFQGWAQGQIRLLTLAPERPGALELIRHAVAHGVVVSLGHHLASNEQLAAGVAAGARTHTHVGNGIPNMIHRHQNSLWWILASDDLTGFFITDGHHLPPDLIKVALRAKGTERFVVTSDASFLGGMPAGRYTSPDGLPIIINEQGRIYSEQSQSLAGSHATMLECMNHLASLGVLDEGALWQVGFTNPLALLGVSPRQVMDLPGPTVAFEDGRFVLAGVAGCHGACSSCGLRTAK